MVETMFRNKIESQGIDQDRPLQQVNTGTKQAQKAKDESKFTGAFTCLVIGRLGDAQSRADEKHTDL